MLIQADVCASQFEAKQFSDRWITSTQSQGDVGALPNMAEVHVGCIYSTLLITPSQWIFMVMQTQWYPPTTTTSLFSHR